MPSPDKIGTVHKYFKAIIDDNRLDITTDHLKEAVEELTKEGNRDYLSVTKHPGLRTKCYASKKGSITNKTSKQKKIYHRKVQIDAQRFLCMHQRLSIAEKCYGVDNVEPGDWMWSHDIGKSLHWSHLCRHGKEGCINPEHGFVENVRNNVMRNTCPGTLKCGICENLMNGCHCDPMGMLLRYTVCEDCKAVVGNDLEYNIMNEEQQKEKADEDGFPVGFNYSYVPEYVRYQRRQEDGVDWDESIYEDV